MSFEIKKTKKKVEARYKSLYISESLANRVQKIADENNTSFNNVVISMIEACLNDFET
ncbi:MAG: hypothetical protein HFF49_06505 [Lawsonibacter sp.]|jgi:hypothetical protein|nr:hypothetical protein [Lawsonibacter sp.]